MISPRHPDPLLAVMATQTKARLAAWPGGWGDTWVLWASALMGVLVGWLAVVS